MRISEMGGEVALISLIKHNYGVDTAKGLALGIGDDAALIEFGDKLLIVTTDILIENTHFRMDINKPYLLGWKSMAVNLSDIAAMGGEPSYAFVSIGLPDIDVGIVHSIYQGMQDVSAKYGSVIAGGDTVASSCGIVINVTQLGMVERECAARRTGARPGDVVLVTNTLGDSRAGLELLLKRGRAHDGHEYVVARHLKPEPRLREARAAVVTGKLHAMMDLSDGLSADLLKLCECSGVGARIDAARIPISPEMRACAAELGADPVMLAASGGEDYELLLACAPEDAETIAEAIEGTGSRATVVGEFTSGNNCALVTKAGDEPMPGSWQHF
jgi:thiamine-monophosphate kinase